MNKNKKEKKRKFILNVLLSCMCFAVLSVGFCMGHFVMVPVNLTLSTFFATFFFFKKTSFLIYIVMV